MPASPIDATPVEIQGFLFREYFVGRFSVGGSGPKYSLPGQIRASWRLPRVRIRFDQTRFVATSITSKGDASNFPLVTGGSWSYHEIQSAQIFESPRWARMAGLSHEEFPTGVRLHFGESRSSLLLFTAPLDEVLRELDEHHVKADRSPIKLSPMLFGRR